MYFLRANPTNSGPIYVEGMLLNPGDQIALQQVAQIRRIARSNRADLYLQDNANGVAAHSLVISDGVTDLPSAAALDLLSKDFVPSVGADQECVVFNLVAGVWTAVPTTVAFSELTDWYFLDASGEQIEVAARLATPNVLEICANQNLVITAKITGEL